MTCAECDRLLHRLEEREKELNQMRHDLYKAKAEVTAQEMVVKALRATMRNMAYELEATR